MRSLIVFVKFLGLAGLFFNSAIGYTESKKIECFNQFNSLQELTLKDSPKSKESLKVLDHAINLQDKIEEMITELSILQTQLTNLIHKSNPIMLELQNIHKYIDSTNVFSPKEWKEQGYERQVLDLEKNIQDLKMTGNHLAKENKIIHLQEVIDSPEFILLADKPYSVELPNSQIYTVYFNKKVVKALQTVPLKAFKRTLSTILKGFNNKNGLKIFRQNKSLKYNKLLEIHTVGKTVGYIRIGGFIHKKEIHFSNYNFSSDHSNKVSKIKFKGSLFQDFKNFQEKLLLKSF